MDVIASPSRSCSGRCGSRGCVACGHDDLHSAGGFQGMEEGDHGDDGGAVASSREVAAAPRRSGLSVYSWAGCSRSALLASAWTIASGPGIYGPSRAWERQRVLAFLVASQVLRIITFYSTQLPGPNYHCREGSKMATLPPPNNVLEVLLINFPRGLLFGCGDLIFSSHMIFTLVFVRTYNKYGSKRFIKLLAWFMAIIQSLLIIASRKHYTVDVVVAWYTVNLVVFFVDSKLLEMPERTNGLPLLPLSTREKDSRLKEERDSRLKDEFHQLLNGNHVDPTDRRQRAQMNGRHDENLNHTSHGTLSDATANGT